MLIWIIAEEYGGRLAAAGRRLKEEDLGLSEVSFLFSFCMDFCCLSD